MRSAMNLKTHSVDIAIFVVSLTVTLVVCLDL